MLFDPHQYYPVVFCTRVRWTSGLQCKKQHESKAMISHADEAPRSAGSTTPEAQPLASAALTPAHLPL